MRKILTNSIHKLKTRKKTFLPLILALIFLFVSMAVVYASVVDVTITDGDKVIAVKTLKTDPYEILAENNISVTPNDSVTYDENGILIKRAKSVQVSVDGETKLISSCGDTVADALSEAQISINPNDNISVPADTKLEDGMQVSISRVIEKTLTQTESISYDTKKVAVTDLDEGETRVKTEGQSGELVKEFKVVYKDGSEIGRSLISQTVAKQPVTQVVEYGKKPEVKKAVAPAKAVQPKTVSASRLRYKKVITCSASAYTLYQGSSGSTATGMQPRYGVIAVDPRVIPLGSRLYIEAADGSYVYGTAIAGDTGGAIKGNTVDLFFNSVAECRSFGRRTVNVYILE